MVFGTSCYPKRQAGDVEMMRYSYDTQDSCYANNACNTVSLDNKADTVSGRNSAAFLCV